MQKERQLTVWFISFDERKYIHVQRILEDNDKSLVFVINKSGHEETVSLSKRSITAYALTGPKKTYYEIRYGRGNEHAN
jgi:hypothetical protein